MTKLNVNIGRVPPLNLALSVGTITVLHAKLVSEDNGHPVYDKPKFEAVVSVKINFDIGQLMFSFVVNFEPSKTIFEFPPEPNNVLKNEKSVIRPAASMILIYDPQTNNVI